MDREDLAQDPNYVVLANRLQRRDEINALVAQWTADRPVEDVVDLLVKGGLTAAPVRTPDQAAKDPHILARDMLQDTQQLDGSSAPIVGPAAKFSRTPTRVRSGAPALGAHDGEILEELGLSAQEIDALREKKIIV